MLTDRKPTIREGWGLGRREWVLYIDPALAPTPADAYEIPSAAPDSNLLGLYGETYHETWSEALNALADWYETRRTDMSKIMLTVTETVEYRAEVEVTGDLLDEAAELGYSRTPSGVREMLEDSDGEHDAVVEIAHDDNAWAVYDRYVSGRVA